MISKNTYCISTRYLVNATWQTNKKFGSPKMQTSTSYFYMLQMVCVQTLGGLFEEESSLNLLGLPSTPPSMHCKAVLYHLKCLDMLNECRAPPVLFSTAVVDSWWKWVCAYVRCGNRGLKWKCVSVVTNAGDVSTSAKITAPVFFFEPLTHSLSVHLKVVMMSEQCVTNPINPWQEVGLCQWSVLGGKLKSWTEPLFNLKLHTTLFFWDLLIFFALQILILRILNVLWEQVST